MSSSAVRCRTTAGEAQRRISSTAVAGRSMPPALPLVRMLQKRQHAVGDRLPGGLVAGHGRIMKKKANSSLLRRWPSASGWTSRLVTSPRSSVDPRLGGRVGVGEHLDDARQVGAGVLRVLAARHLVAPVEELLAILVGDAHEAGDGLQGQMAGDVEHEVARALSLGRPDDPVRPFAQLVLEPGQGARGEAPVSHPAHPGVPGRVHAEQEVLGGLARGIGLVQPAHEGRVGLHRPLESPGDRRHVGVAGERPESGVAVGRRRTAADSTGPVDCRRSQANSSRGRWSATRSGSLRSRRASTGVEGTTANLLGLTPLGTADRRL